MHLFSFRPAFLAGLSLTVAACGSDSTAPSSTPKVQFINAIAGPSASDAYDFSIDGAAKSTGVGFAGSSSCVEVPSGDVTFNVTKAGTGTSVGTPFPFPYTIESRTRYTLIVHGRGGYGGMAILPDTFQTLPAAGRARVRVLRTWQDTDPFPNPNNFIDVYADPPGSAPTTQVMADLGPYGVGLGSLLDLPATRTQFTFTRSGTTTGIAGGVVDLQSRQTVTVVMSNVPGGTGMRVFVVTGCQ